MKQIQSNISILSVMKVLLLCVAVLSPVFLTGCQKGEKETTRKERRLISAGNKLYREGKFADAKVKYKNALEENPSSAVAMLNMGLCDYRLADMSKDNDSIRTRLIQDATASFQKVAELGDRKPSLSSKANYNLGNIQFESENYGGAIACYKESLRMNPENDDARFNLRIAQLKQDNQEDQNQDQNQDKENEQDQQEDKQDQNQDQQDQNQDQQDQQDQQQNEQPKENELSPQAAQQILNAVENNEQRARGSNKGKEAQGRGSSLKKW